MTPAELAATVLVRLDMAVLGYFLVINTFYAGLLLSAALELRHHRRSVWEDDVGRVLGSEMAPALSVLAPAHNEAATVLDSVRGLLGLRYPNLQVIVVNDGSTDDTLETLRDGFDLVAIHPIYDRQVPCEEIVGLYRSRATPDLLVVDKRNGGKADALNAALNVASGELVCAIDADTLIEPDAMLRIVRPFLQRDDVVAAGGTIRVGNNSKVRRGRVTEVRAPRRPLAGIQSVEYLRAFLFGRLGWNRLGGNLIISGAFGLFRRDAMLAAGGYQHDTVGEDMELVANLRRRGLDHGTPSRVHFVPDPVGWTEVPEELTTLGRQRDRWQRGLADVLWRYRGVLGRPRYGALGLVVYPYFLFVELLAPVIEAVALVGLVLGLAVDAVDLRFAALFFCAAYGYGMLLTVATLVLDEVVYHRYAGAGDRARMLGWALLENCGYRQLTVAWRLRGMLGYLRRRTEWGVMTRRGFTEAESASADTGAGSTVAA